MAAVLQQELVKRVRSLLPLDVVVREVAMFGGQAVMVNEKMIVSAGKQGDLLVRVPADRHSELVARPDACQAEMGAGRDMGPGWITVAAESVEDDNELAFWIDVAMEQNRIATSQKR